MRLLLAFVLFAVPSVASAADPVYALLDPAKHPRVALLEVKLLADADAAWVERNQIDKVLAEQKLQALFAPQGVGERVKLGKLLKADVLVCVRPAKRAKDADPTDAALEVVVSETAGGLRLLVRAVPLTKAADADVAALLSAVRDGIKRHGQTVTEVVAVPPFLSQDLTSEFDHLKAAYARLAEAACLDRPGVAVVEFTEAEALAKELALTNPGGKPARPLPVYLLGEYRHDGKGDARTVALKLRAERGGKPVGKPASATVKPGDAAGAVREWAAGVLDPLAKVEKPTRYDPKAEAKQLIARSDEYRRLGHWAEALALIEAALLIDPPPHKDTLAPFPPDPKKAAELRVRWQAQVQLHLDAVSLVHRLCDDVSPHWPTDADAAQFEACLRAHLRGLAHLEAYLDRRGSLSLVAQRGRVTEFLRADLRTRWFELPLGKGARAARWNEFHGTQREVLLRLIPKAAARGFDDAVLVQAAICHLPPAERYELLEKIILGLKDVRPPRHPARPEKRPDEWTTRTVNYFVGNEEVFSFMSREFLAFLGRLEESEHPELRAAAVEIRRRFVRPAAGPAAGPDPLPPDPNEPRPELVKFVPIQLDFGPDGGGTRAVERAMELFRFGPGVDVLAVRESAAVSRKEGDTLVTARPSRESLYLMTEKGKPRQVWTGEAVSAFYFRSDGKFVWVTVRRASKPSLLLVLDPAAGKVHEVTKEHGLPAVSPDPKNFSLYTVPHVGVVGPGRVCLAGRVERDGPTWVAVATFDPKAGPAVKVVHEARAIHDRYDRKAPGPDAAFDPAGFRVLTRPGPDGKPQTRVLLSRRLPNYSFREPLLIDPDRGSVEVLREADRAAWAPDPPAGDVAETYTVAPTDPSLKARPNPLKVWRVKANGEREAVADGLPDAHGARLRWRLVHDGRYNFVVARFWAKTGADGVVKGQERFDWWQFDPATKALRLLAVDVPHFGQDAGTRVETSAHYGLVAIVRVPGHSRPVLCAIEFAPPRKKADDR